MTYEREASRRPLALFVLSINKNCISDRFNDSYDRKNSLISESLGVTDLEKLINKDRHIDNGVGQCYVCFECVSDSIIQECGHGGLCFSCATNM